jgi:Putative DNA-binding domain
VENRPLADLVAALDDAATAWIRVTVTRASVGWQLAVLELTSGEPPPSWHEVAWEYEYAVFVAATVAGSEAARWLAEQRLELGRVDLPLDDLPTQVQVERRESRFAGGFEPLPWPSLVWSVRLDTSHAQQLPGELIADGLRPFLNFDQAAAAFFGISRPNRSFGGRELIYRRQDRRGRIEAVRIRPTEVVVGVSGEALEGATVAIGGERVFPTERLGPDTVEVHLPTDEPLPPDAWLALHRDRELLDKRYLGPSWAQAGVEVEVDAATRLAVVIAGGEGATTEFKRELPAGNQRAIQRAIKSVAAFANGDGGTIVYGVDDEGAAVGLGDLSLREAADRLTNILSDYVRPLPHFAVDVVARAQVIVVTVDAGIETPYGVGTSDRDIVYYVRRGATTFPAAPGDVRAMVRARDSVRDPLAHLRLR